MPDPINEYSDAASRAASDQPKSLRFRKKPLVIEAVQLRWDTWGQMCDHAHVGSLAEGAPQGVEVNAENTIVERGGDGRIALAIPTLEGLMVAVEGDWVIRGVAGELYPCKPDIFERTYQPADEADVIGFTVDDPHYPATLNFYADRLEAGGGDPDRVRLVRLLANEMREAQVRSTSRRLANAMAEDQGRAFRALADQVDAEILKLGKTGPETPAAVDSTEPK